MNEASTRRTAPVLRVCGSRSLPMSPISDTRSAPTSGHGVWSRLVFAVLVLGLCGCAAVLSLDYRPSNTVQGQGGVTVGTFVYEGATSGRLGPKEVHTNPRGVGKVYLSQDVAIFFSEALHSELKWSGYQMGPDQDREVRGTITRFYLDWVDAEAVRFDVDVDYEVRLNGQVVHAHTVRSYQTGAKLAVTQAALIKRAVADSIQQFLEQARQEGVL